MSYVIILRISEKKSQDSSNAEWVSLTNTNSKNNNKCWLGFLNLGLEAFWNFWNYEI